MQIVLDANIYISSLISDQGNPAKILKKWEARELDIVVSPEIIGEIERVLDYARLQRKYKRIRENREELIERLRKMAVIVSPAERLSIVENDESDNRYIECAVESGARYIVTGDPHLLDIKEYKGIRIITPATFVILWGYQDS